jgi:hypothetical protein
MAGSGRDKWKALLNVVMNHGFQKQNAGKLSSAYTTGGLLSSAQPHNVSHC